MSYISFYRGEVRHTRFVKPHHRFRYGVAYVLLDLDKLKAANDQSALLGVDRPGLMAVLAKDHGDRTGGDLAQWVKTKVKNSGADEVCARIELLTLPRMFGFVFNPISAYFIYDEQNRLHHMLYEVRNTFGERKEYLCRVDMSTQANRHSAQKQLYVSPFFDVEGKYEFAVRAPDERAALTIDYQDAEKTKLFNACFIGEKTPVTSWQCLKILIGFPFMTIGVVFAIHWEALKLWIKGARYRPAPSEQSSSGVLRNKEKPIPLRSQSS